MPGVAAMSGRVQRFAFRSGVGIGPRDAFGMVFVPVTLLAWVTWLPLVWVTLVGWVPVYARFRMRCIVIDHDARSLSVRNFWVTRMIAFDDVSGVEWRSRHFWFVLNVRTVGGDIPCGGVTQARKTTRLLRLEDVTARVEELHVALVSAGVAGVRLLPAAADHD